MYRPKKNYCWMQWHAVKRFGFWLVTWNVHAPKIVAFGNKIFFVYLSRFRIIQMAFRLLTVFCDQIGTVWNLSKSFLTIYNAKIYTLTVNLFFFHSLGPPPMNMYVILMYVFKNANTQYDLTMVSSNNNSTFIIITFVIMKL